jgi:hypothetical protein
MECGVSAGYAGTGFQKRKLLFALKPAQRIERNILSWKKAVCSIPARYNVNAALFEKSRQPVGWLFSSFSRTNQMKICYRNTGLKRGKSIARDTPF